ncbi:MAG: response regulator [Sedimentisphaeraceae bacterium JB056]
MSENKNSDNWRVMIVDDTPQNLKLLQNMLLRRGYDVYAIPNGRMALNAIEKIEPDIILLDINMPDIDGYEVCRSIKQTKKYSTVPIIFVSVIGETTNKIEGFKAGGVDYITKPFQFEEVDARIKNHLKIYQLSRQLEHQNKTLNENVRSRTSELAEVNEKLRALDRVKSDFLNMISYQMRSQAGGLLNILDELFTICPKIGPWSQIFELYVNGRKRMTSLLDDAVFLNSYLYDYLQRDNLPVFIVGLLEKIALDNGVTLALDTEDEIPLINGLGSDLVEKAIDIIFRLALCFNFNKEYLRVAANVSSKKVRLSFKLDNVCVDPIKAKEFFNIESSVRASTIAEDMGLSPVVAHRIISLLGGDVFFGYERPGDCSIEVSVPVGIPPMQVYGDQDSSTSYYTEEPF